MAQNVVSEIELQKKREVQQQQAQDAAYNDAIASAQRNVEYEFYELAKQDYRRAIEIKPDNKSFINRKIAEIDKLIADEKETESIDKIIAKIVNTSELSNNIKTVKFVVWRKNSGFDFIFDFRYNDIVDVLASAEFKDGGFTLNLPKEVPSQYLQLVTEIWNGTGVTISNKNAKIFYQLGILDIFGYNSSDKRIASFYCNRRETEPSMRYIYTDSDVNISGTKTIKHENGDTWMTINKTVALALKKGWNVVYCFLGETYSEVRSSPAFTDLQWAGYEFGE